MAEPDDPVAAVAAAVRVAYCEARNEWHRVNDRRTTTWGSRPVPTYDGGPDGRGVVRTSAWERVARVALAAGVDPVDLVKAQFRVRRAHPPEPNQLSTPAALAEYAASAPDRLRSEQQAFRFQRAAFQAELDKLAPCQASRGWGPDDLVRVVLGNVMAPLSALFRHCAAAAGGPQLADLAEAFRREAVVQYLAAPAVYDAVWRGFIPASFSAAAAAVVRGAVALGPDTPPQSGAAVAPAVDPPPAYRRPVRD